MTRKRIKTLLLGGGISSVSFSHFTDDNDYLIVEKESSLGGLCRSFHVGNSTFDFSGHFMHFNNPDMQQYVKTLVEKHTDGELKEYNRDASIAILKRGILDRDIDYPFQANIHQLAKDDFIECLVDLYNADKNKTQNPSIPRTFDDLVKLTFGNKITELFFKPYNEKMYCTKLSKMSADAMQRFIPSVNFDEVMQNIARSTKQQFGYNSKFLYLPKTGIQGLVDSFVKEKPVNHVLNTEVVGIDLENKVVTVKDKNETYYIEYERLINTLPLNFFLKLSGREVPASFQAMDVSIFNLTYDGAVSNIEDRCWTYFPSAAVPFYRVGFYNYMSGKKDTSLYVEVSTKHGEKTNETVKSIDLALKHSGVIEERAELVDSQSLNISPAYVIISSDSKDDLGKLLTELKDTGVESLGRYGLWTYQSIEDNILDAKALAEKLT